MTVILILLQISDVRIVANFQTNNTTRQNLRKANKANVNKENRKSLYRSNVFQNKVLYTNELL